ncbi:methyl-accepting chemotaxis protein [Oceanobacillus sp. CAU 1775]
MFKLKRNTDINLLINELEQMEQVPQQEEIYYNQISLKPESDEMKELVDSMNKYIRNMQEKYIKLYEKYQIVTELNNIGTWDLEIKNGEPTENNIYNDIFRHALGYEDENDFPNKFKSWYDSVAPDEANEVTKAFEEHYDKDLQKDYNIEFKSVKKDGSIEWFHGKADTLRNELGEPYRNVGTLVNIHENKLNAIRVQNLLSRLELIEKSLSYSVSTLEGSWGMDLQAEQVENKLWFSPQFKRLVGLDDEASIYELDAWMDLIVSDEREQVKDTINNFLYNQTNQLDLEIKFQMETSPSNPRWFTMLLTVVRDVNGNATLLSGLLRDINHEIERQLYDDRIESEMDDFTNLLSELTGNIRSNTNEATEIAKEHEVTTRSADEAKACIDLTKSITDLIKNISTQTNLLGLNASIEAARAGEQGKGFSVVASEVQKLSLNTAEAVEQIEKILEDISDAVLNIVTSINNMSDKIQSQAVVTEEINATTDHINVMSGKLLELMKEIN